MAAQSVQILPGLSDSQLPTARSADVSVIDVQSTLFRGPSFLCESSETSKRTASLIDVIHDDKIDIEEEERVYRAFDQVRTLPWRLFTLTESTRMTRPTLLNVRPSLCAPQILLQHAIEAVYPSSQVIYRWESVQKNA